MATQTRTAPDPATDQGARRRVPSLRQRRIRAVTHCSRGQKRRVARPPRREAPVFRP